MIRKLISSLSILFVIQLSANSQILSGKYRSNFADLGFFITEIKFEPNFSFYYTFSGDLQHIELKGHYTKVKKFVYLRFDILKDDINKETVQIIGNDTIVDLSHMKNTHSYDLKSENGIEYHLKYKAKGSKLFSYHSVTNKIVKRTRYYSNRKRFLIFGPEYHYKKWYLKKYLGQDSK